MRYAPRAILAGGLGFAVACVAACGGGSGLLAGDESISLNGQAEEISSAVQSGNCGAATNASAALQDDVQKLPAGVNPTLRRNLSQGAATIARLAQKDCRQSTETTSSTPTTTSTSTSTSTTTPSTTSTSTSTSTPTTTSTTSTTSSTATTPTETGTTSTTTGGAGLGAGTTTGGGNDNSGGAGAQNGTSSGPGGGG